MVATASTKNGPKNGDQTETVCYISVLASLALNFGPQTGATIPRSLRLGGSRAATTLAITLPGTLMYILPIKYHAKCSARLFQEYPRQVYTVCFSYGKLRATSLAEKATSVPRKRPRLFLKWGWCLLRPAIQTISELKHSMLFLLRKAEGALGGDLGALTIS